ncbi:hypothetical protein, partial [Amycolatopsis acidiphila]|uniref:hypothetical protein n=1 Tax=Amycolatopsis acidiphila TaxID=715473 RepID=UPI001C94A19C
PGGTGLVGWVPIGFAGTVGVPGGTGWAGWQLIGFPGTGVVPGEASTVSANAVPAVPNMMARPVTTMAAFRVYEFKGLPSLLG